MRKFTVTGMSCAACSTRVEKAVSSLDGIKSCSVSLLTGTMGVEGDTSDEIIIKAVTEAGYGAQADTNNKQNGREEKEPADLLYSKETKALLVRLVSSIIFLAALMYISMGHIMWGWYLPQSVAQNPIGLGLLQLILSAIIIIINNRFFVSGFRAFLHKAPNMDSLVALGSGASFVYSVCVLFSMTKAISEGNYDLAMHGLHDLYFESAAMILSLITVGKMLESISKGRTTSALRALLDMSPKKATVLIDGEERIVSADELRIDDIFVVKPGESFAADGVVVEGCSAVDESALTGESLPQDKNIGDSVSAGTINLSGYVKCSARRIGENTTLSQIIKIVSDASATKAPIAKIADKVSGVFVPVVIAIALLSGFVWLLAGESIGFSLSRAVSVLVISCPCALGLATPVAIMVGSGVGAKKGILFKTAASLEACGQAEIVCLDKTGTITKGEMSVTNILPTDDFDSEYLISLAASVEEMSEHPLGKAIVRYANDKHIKIMPVNNFSTISGKGVEAKDSDGNRISGGNLKFIESLVSDKGSLAKLRADAEKLAESGKTPMFFALEDRLVGIIGVADTIKEDSPSAIKELQNMGMFVVMLTGDNRTTAKAIASVAGVDKVIASVMPAEKADVVKALQKHGKVIMVGDGINDSPALATADTGIAIGRGTDIAIDSADVVLMNSSLADLPRALKLSRATLKNIHQNLFWAFIYNIVGIPLAAGVWIPLFNLELNPMFGALAMSLSSFCVVTNALRLNFVSLDKPQRRRHKKILAIEELNNEKEEFIMTKTMTIEGMMCPHCSGRVKKTLEALGEVELAEVSHEKGTAIVTLKAAVSDDLLKKTVEEQGYKVISID